MGKIKQGVFGGFMGKVGNVVGATWRGISYIRIMPQSVGNPRTPKQLAVRMRFTLAVGFLRSFRSFLQIGYKNYAQRMTPVNAALSQVLRNAIAGEYPDYSIDFEKVLVTRGTLRPAGSAYADSLTPGIVTVNWDQTGLSTDNALDNAMVVVYYPGLDYVQYELSAGTRGDGEASIELPATLSGTTVHVWLAFSALESMVGTNKTAALSDSFFAGSVIVE